MLVERLSSSLRTLMPARKQRSSPRTLMPVRKPRSSPRIQMLVKRQRNWPRTQMFEGKLRSSLKTQMLVDKLRKLWRRILKQHNRQKELPRSYCRKIRRVKERGHKSEWAIKTSPS